MLHERALRRLSKHASARAFNTWSDAVQEQRATRRMLQRSAARIALPRLAAGFYAWAEDFEAKKAKDLEKERALMIRHAEEERSALQQKLTTSEEREALNVGLAVKHQAQVEGLEEQVRKLQRELATAREAMAAGRGQEVEMQRRMEEELEREKERRIEHTKQMALRRIMQKDLGRGWSAWHGQWSQVVRARSLLRKSAAALSKPKLVASFAHWQRDWEVDKAARVAMTNEKKLQEEREQCKRLQAEVARLTAELRGARKAALEGRGRHTEAHTALRTTHHLS